MNVVLFGAGEVCDSFIEKIPDRLSVVAVADNNTNLHGGKKNGFPIISPSDIYQYKPDFIIISCVSRHISNILSQLKELGLIDLYLPFPHDEVSEKKDKKELEKKNIIGCSLVNEIFECKNENGSVFYHISLGNEFEKKRKKYIEKPVNRHIHIGSGHSVGMEIYSLLRWGGEWTAIEPYPGLGGNYPFNEHVSIVRKLMELFGIPCVSGDEISFTSNNNIENLSLFNNKGKSLNYFPSVKFEDFTTTEQYEVCYSCAVLEHVVDVQLFIDKTFELLDSGGYAFHWIDLRDHRDFFRPLEFLKIRSLEWKDLYSDDGYFLHGNQLRCSDFRRLFIQSGFNVIAEEICERNAKEYIDEVKDNIADEFLSLTWSDLEIAGVLFVLKKP